jgi:hypothetical protein
MLKDENSKYKLIWNDIKEKALNKNLIFIHTPKCAGSYVSRILQDFKIINKGHNNAIINEGINFTVIRDPVDRFESLLNYRLGEKHPRNDWPKHLHNVYNNKDITLNEIVNKMSDGEILNFAPYKTLVFWSKNVDIIITIDKLFELLAFFGYNYDEKKYKYVNVSVKTRGRLNEENKTRIALLYNADMKLYNNVINQYI